MMWSTNHTVSYFTNDTQYMNSFSICINQFMLNEYDT